MIVATGGVGVVGGDIVRMLSQRGVAARALVRNAQKAKNLPGITWVAGDLAKPETLPAAFEGADTLFLVSSIGEDTVALQHNAIVAAGDAGIGQIEAVGIRRLESLFSADLPLALPIRA